MRSDGIEGSGAARRRPGRAIERFLRLSEVAALLSVSVRTVRRWELDGRFPGSVLLGDDVRVPESALRAFLGTLSRERGPDRAVRARQARQARQESARGDVRTLGVGG